MHNSFQNQLQRLVNQPKSKRFLIAASGGLDSTVLIDLCNTLKLDFAICHVNFKLRGKDSEDDQLFLEKIANQLNVPIFILEKDVKPFAKANQLSTQEAARQIRYDWFNSCIEKHHYDYVMTAHHANDDVETYLINSFRGTGIKGLTGISDQRDDILRPLLKYPKNSISDYAKVQHLNWREDESNASDNYLRNVIRHHVIPFFDKRQDNFHTRFKTTQQNLIRQNDLLEDYLNMAFKQVVQPSEDTYRFNIKTLETFPNPKSILIELLQDFGFTDWDSVYDLTTAQVGKFVKSSRHKLVKERGFLELFVLKDKTHQPITIDLNTLPKTVVFPEGEIHFEFANNFKKNPSEIAYVSKDLLKSEFILRPYKMGDYFYPLGMQGKRKLSDFLKDEKLTTFEKSKIWVLTNQNEIVWVVNHRIDNRFKITENTQECLKIQFLPYC